MIPKYYIETYGCQMNVYDTELVSSLLNTSGFEKTNDIKLADAIFLNTCSIREKAEQTVHNRLDNLKSLKEKHPDLLIGVLGCMAQNLKDDLLKSKSYIDIILGPDNFRNIPEIIQQRKKLNGHFVDTKLSKFEIYDELFPARENGINAWISIGRGCDNFCTFCIVPFVRGRERSRSISKIVNETKKAIDDGFVEITLLGQNVNSFKTPDGNFPELIRSVAAVKGVKRVRYTSPHPRDMDDRLLETMRDHDNICKHIHLPLQAGSDRILKRMNRTYTKIQYLTLIDKIRDYMPDCSITTDIIVGFPGETECEFDDTLDVVKKVVFDSAFMFKFSPRPGTKAAEYSDQIDENIKQRRLEKLIALQKRNTLTANQRHIGKRLEVIVEKTSKKSADQWAGRTDGNVWVVWDKIDERIKNNVTIQIDDAQGVTLFGHRNPK